MRRASRWFLALAAVAAPSTAFADPSTEGCPPWCPAPHTPPHVSAHAKGRWRPGFAMRALSVQGAEEHTRIGADDHTAGSFGVEERALAYLSLGKVNARYTDFFTMGGGPAGFDGGLGIDAAIGFRPLIGEHHGPIARLGLRAHYRYHQHFHSSLLELPQLELGYAYLRKTLHLEVGVRGGPVLTGRYGVDGGATTNLSGTFEVGGYLAFGARPVRFDLEASRVRLDAGPEGPVESIDALLCGALSRPIVCFHGSAARGDLLGVAGLTRATATYIGLTVGIGPVTWR